MAEVCETALTWPEAFAYTAFLGLGLAFILAMIWIIGRITE